MQGKTVSSDARGGVPVGKESVGKGKEKVGDGKKAPGTPGLPWVPRGLGRRAVWGGGMSDRLLHMEAPNGGTLQNRRQISKPVCVCVHTRTCRCMPMHKLGLEAVSWAAGMR